MPGPNTVLPHTDQAEVLTDLPRVRVQELLPRYWAGRGSIPHATYALLGLYGARYRTFRPRV